MSVAGFPTVWGSHKETMHSATGCDRLRRNSAISHVRRP